ncbi:hypothetical protein KKG31_00395 [Patescibacteria group bacterium]|nr:hypothetical protein [Patescibacteria group bacterium]MBU1757649.1 hypothetical protein [Patescibacteria group bacterium]
MKKEVYEFVSKKLNDKILERKKCEQCTEDFPIFQKDQELLEKIAPTVGGKKQSFTSPQFCPDCRARQRLVWRNEWNFYSAKSALSGEKLFSLYSPLSNIPVISNDEFFSDAFDAMIYGKDIDMNTSILTQIGELRKKVPTQATMTIDNQNCYYTTGTGYNKNCYLINSSENCEDCMYGKLFQTCKKCMDCSYVYDSEKLYECINVKK